MTVFGEPGPTPPLAQPSRGETPNQELEREWDAQEAAGTERRPTNQLVGVGEWIWRVPFIATSLVVHVVHFANGHLARCKCGLILNLADGVQVLPVGQRGPPLDEQQCQGCWGITPDLRPDRKAAGEPTREPTRE